MPDTELVDSRLNKLLAESDVSDATGFLGAQFDAGLAWVHFPDGAGGLSAPRRLQATVDARIHEAGGPRGAYLNPIGYGMVAPTIVEHGTQEQRLRFLRPLFTAEELWCQLFSEPGAGSDLAGLGTRAAAVDGGWVLNGQKVWSSLAHVARWGLLLARTDPAQPKHNGLTAFVLDMAHQGVEVRPLRQMTGDAEFNEVYLTDVFLPDTLRLGAIGDGWRVAVTTLMNERVSIGGGARPRGSGPIADALTLYHERPRPGALRDRLVQLWIRAELNRLTNARAAAARARGAPGPEGSITKLSFAEVHQAIHNLIIDLLGPEALLAEHRTMHRPTTVMEPATPQQTFLRSRAYSIEGGTSEILRNVLAERVLGLPAEPRADKGMPWQEIPRG